MSAVTFGRDTGGPDGQLAGTVECTCTHSQRNQVECASGGPCGAGAIAVVPGRPAWCRCSLNPSRLGRFGALDRLLGTLRRVCITVSYENGMANQHGLLRCTARRPGRIAARRGARVGTAAHRPSPHSGAVDAQTFRFLCGGAHGRACRRVAAWRASCGAKPNLRAQHGGARDHRLQPVQRLPDAPAP